MDQETLQLGDMFKTKTLTYRSEKTGNQLQISIWNGIVGFTVFGKQSSGNIFRKTLNAEQLTVVDAAFDNLINMPPESHQSLTIQKWNQEQRKMLPEFQLNLIKDERQVYMIELKGHDNNGGDFSDRFSIFIKNDIVLNAEPFKPAESSSYGAKYFRQYLKIVAPSELSLSARRMSGKSFGNNKGGQGKNNEYNRGNSYNRNNNRGPNSEVDTGNPMHGFDNASSDDMPF